MTTTGIILNTTFTNSANLPSALSRQDQIKAISSLEMWAQADAAHVTLDGSEITTFSDVGGSDGAFAPIDAGASLLADQLGGYAAASFDSADDPRYTASDVTLAEDSPYSYVAVYKPDDTATDRGLLGRFNSSTVRAMLAIASGSGYGRLYHGSGTHFFTVDPTEWSLIIACFDGTNLKAYCNGTYTTPAAASGGTGTAAISLGGYSGAPADGLLTDALVFSEDIIGSGKDELIIDHFTAIYGSFS